MSKPEKNLDDFPVVFAPGAFGDLPKDVPLTDEQGQPIEGHTARVDQDADGLTVEIRTDQQ